MSRLTTIAQGSTSAVRATLLNAEGDVVTGDAAASPDLPRHPRSGFVALVEHQRTNEPLTTLLPATTTVLWRREALDAVAAALGPVDSLDDLLFELAALMHERGYIGQQLGMNAARGSRSLLESHAARARHPHFAALVQRQRESFTACLTTVVSDTTPLRVALDLRHVRDLTVGTSTYANVLRDGLTKRRDLSLHVVRDPTPLPTGIDLVHKPAPCFDPRELNLLFDSTALVALTQLDLIAYHAQTLFENALAAERYRATSMAALQAAQGVFTISHTAKREVVAEARLPTSEVWVTPMGVDGATRPPLSRAQRRQQVLCVGSDFPHKNMTTMLAAFADLRAEQPQLELVCVGGKARSTPSIEAPGVRDLGSVSDATLAELYRESSALVFPSLYEGFGIPVLEAMAAGTPVVLFRGSAQEEVAGEAGIFAPRLTAAALAQTLRHTLTDEATWERAAQQGVVRANAYSWQQCLDLTVSAYREMVHTPSARSIEARRRLAPLLCEERLGIKRSAEALAFAVKRRIDAELGKRGAR